MFSIIIIFLFQNVDLIDFIKRKSNIILKSEAINKNRPDINFCPCRLLQTYRYEEYCIADYPENPFGADHIINNSIMFDDNFTQTCYYYSQGFIAGKIELFPEVRDQCSTIFLENEANGIYLDSSLTISFDERYIIPYCYGMGKLYIYEIKSLSFFLGK